MSYKRFTVNFIKESVFILFSEYLKKKMTKINLKQTLPVLFFRTQSTNDNYNNLFGDLRLFNRFGINNIDHIHT